LDKNGIPIETDSVLPEDKTWSELDGCGVSQLVKSGWRLDKIMSHFGVKRSEVFYKMRFEWTLAK
jgi:hypothetical protein